MTTNRNKVRIIGGQWRSRQITFPSLPGLRPTTDRIRETLFNWLMSEIARANCLDLFAGSGALGFEALSRGAAKVTFVDSATQVIAALKANAALLQAEQAEFMLGACPDNMPRLAHAPFDIVFLDPPFNKGWVVVAADWLERSQLLTANALIFIETEKNLHPPPIPKNWEILKEKHTSTLNYYLVKRHVSGSD
jgi:16S rRNA (guanine966-N2)-methyltransferase